MMNKGILYSKGTRLFIVLAGFFICNAIVAEFIGMKIFSLEPTLGFRPLNWDLFGQKGSLMLSSGVLLWPIVFIMTDIINEYFGRKGVKMLSYLTAGLISYAFIMVFVAIELTPAGFWMEDYIDQGVPNTQDAFSVVFGQGMWLIVGSLVAFLIGQIVDAFVFYKVRQITGDQKIWLRATASTLVSQFIDSFVVLYIAFVLGPPKWPTSLFLAVGTVNYGYKLVIAIVLIPMLYLVHYLIDNYLGKNLAIEMKEGAMNS